GRAGPTQAVSPGRRHVADARMVVALDRLDLLVNRVAAFESHERGELAFGGGAAYVCGGRGERPSFRMLFGERADSRDLFVSASAPARVARNRAPHAFARTVIEEAAFKKRGAAAKGESPSPLFLTTNLTNAHSLHICKR